MSGGEGGERGRGGEERGVRLIGSFGLLCRRERLLKVYEKTLHSYSHILLCRERVDGSLRGLMLIGIDRKPSYTLIKVRHRSGHSLPAFSSLPYHITNSVSAKALNNAS